MAENPRPLLALVDNLFFASKIDGVARHLGYEPAFTNNADEFRRRLREDRPSLIIVDMGSAVCPWEQLVREVKADPATASVPVLAFGKHTQPELFKLARRAGCDRAITNAQLSEQLPEFLATYLGNSTQSK